ncbi:MAG TPA: hypothetical protein GXZ70_04290 [Clostridiales bacterium]|nr:hypothetical protein [Clostridiales bacterium]
MFIEESLSSILQKSNPYPCLALLESGLISYKESEHKTIPQELLKDFACIYGKELADDAIKCLVNLEAIEENEIGLLINDEASNIISSWLNQLKRNLLLTLNNNEESIEEFVVKLISYLKENTSCTVSYKSVENLDFIINSDGKNYSIQAALSPVWLPAVAEDASVQNTFIALIGPFAAQNWHHMIKYYAHPQFRNYTSYYDPWHCQKMNISRGSLLTYFDWFYRDVYGLKFFIPDTFSLALQNMGLLRYNDER